MFKILLKKYYLKRFKISIKNNLQTLEAIAVQSPPATAVAAAVIIGVEEISALGTEDLRINDSKFLQLKLRLEYCPVAPLLCLQDCVISCAKAAFESKIFVRIKFILKLKI